MMKRILVSAALVTAVAAFTVVGCGGSSSNNNGGNTNGDSGPGATGGGDSGTGNPNPGSDGGSPSDSSTPTGNPPLPDGSVYPHGTLLVPGTTLTLDGVTSDNYVIYTDTSSNTAFALSLAAGSKPLSLGTVDTNNDVTVSGKVVFLGTSVSQQTGVGAVSIWTSAATAPAVLSTSTMVGIYGVSADGSSVIFLDAVATSGATGAIAIAANNGSGKATVVPSVDLADSFCFPEIGFGGTYGVAAYCVAGTGAVDAGLPDGGTNFNVGQVSSFASPNWTAVPIASSVETVFSVDSGGTKVVVLGASGTAAYPIAGGTAVPIDANGELGAVTFSPGILTSDGSHLIYTTTAQALERAATTAPASPVQLVPAPSFADIFALSPDTNQSWVIGTLNVNQNNGNGDLYLASATTAGTATTLTSATTGGLNGDPFTADATHVLFYTGLSHGVGSFNSASVTAAGTPTVLGANVVTDLATTAAKVIFNANYNNSTGGADLQGVDTFNHRGPDAARDAGRSVLLPRLDEGDDRLHVELPVGIERRAMDARGPLRTRAV